MEIGCFVTSAVAFEHTRQFWMFINVFPDFAVLAVDGD